MHRVSRVVEGVEKKRKLSLLLSSFLCLKFPFDSLTHLWVFLASSILDCKNCYQTCKSQGTSQHKHPSNTITFALANLGFPLIFLSCALLPLHFNFLSSTFYVCLVYYVGFGQQKAVVFFLREQMIREELGDVGLTLWASEVSIINIGGWTGHNLGQKFQWKNNISATQNSWQKLLLMVVIFVHNFNNVCS